MKSHQGRPSFALYLATFSLLSCDAVWSDQPSPELERDTVPEVSFQKLPPAAGVAIGEIKYSPGNVVPNRALEQAILGQLAGYENCDEDAGKGLRYFYNAVDLNGDAISETVVYLVGSYACGSGGCTALIFRSDDETHQLLSRLVLVNNPIVVSDQTTNGWRDLILYVAGGGAKSAYHVLEHSGSTYPENPSVAPTLKAGTVVTGDAYIANEILFDTPAPVLISEGCAAVEFNLLKSEGFGNLRVDLGDQQVVGLLGEPKIRDQRVLWEADALYHETWRYPEQGIVLDMVSESADDRQRVASIRVGPPSMLRTRRGVGIGDSYSDVEKAYSSDRDEENSDPPLTFVAGSLYGGLVFSFEERRVTQIFLGAAGE